VLTLSSHLALPWQGHLDTLFHLFAYIEKLHNAWIVYDPMYLDIDLRVFKQCDWKQFYDEVKEAIPPNAPPPRGERMLTYICLSTLTRLVTSWHDDRIWLGFLIYLNMALIVWHWKKQSTIETSVFGAGWRSLLLWSKAWRHCEAYDTNYEWWEFKSMDHPIFMVIISLWYITPNDLNWHSWRRNPTQCATMWYTSQLLAMHGWIPNWAHFYAW
jgi:hypothetical protein